MNNYTLFEEEVLERAKKLKFNGKKPFLTMHSQDRLMNSDHFKITFNSIMCKIIMFKKKEELSYAEYEKYFNLYIKTEKKGVKRSFYYDGELVAEVKLVNIKGVSAYAILPLVDEIIKEDVLFMKEYNKNKVN